MELRDLRFFCTAAELGNVTKAAENLGVSQPFVSKVIQRLEDEIGCELFDTDATAITCSSLSALQGPAISNGR